MQWFYALNKFRGTVEEDLILQKLGISAKLFMANDKLGLESFTNWKPNTPSYCIA